MIDLLFTLCKLAAKPSSRFGGCVQASAFNPDPVRFTPGVTGRDGERALRIGERHWFCSSGVCILQPLFFWRPRGWRAWFYVIKNSKKVPAEFPVEMGD